MLGGASRASMGVDMNLGKYWRGRMRIPVNDFRIGGIKAVLLIGLILAISSCSRLPRIVVLHDPLSAEEHNDLGVAYEQEGKLDLAITEYKKALRKEENFVKARINLGNVLFKKGEYEGAKKEYLSSILLDPNNPDPHNNLAWIYITTRENIDEARVLAERALELDQAQDYIYLDTLGMIAFAEGEQDDALRLIVKAIEETPLSEISRLEEAYEHLILVYRMAGLHHKAEEAALKLEELREGVKP